MKETNSPPEFSVILRILGGGYLVYLAWDLRASVQDGPLFLIAVIVFALVGLILAGTSIRYLLQHKYFRNNDINVEDLDEFRQFCVWAAKADMTDKENYKTFCDFMDVQSFMDYMAVQTYINNFDWVKNYTNNWQVWHSKSIEPNVHKADNKWRFIFYDTEYSSGIYNQEDTHYEYDLLNKMYLEKDEKFNFADMLRNLCKNQEFLQAFYDNYLNIIENNFDPNKVIKIIDEYIDEGFSGTNFERPAFKRMISDIESGKINLVITKDLSRLGRDYISAGEFTEIYFPSKGVRYISVADFYDSEDSSADIIPFKNVFNEMYARDISKKIRFAFSASAQNALRSPSRRGPIT